MKGKGIVFFYPLKSTFDVIERILKMLRQTLKKVSTNNMKLGTTKGITQVNIVDMFAIKKTSLTN